jgi:GT2 family glycosyltransferase
MKSISIVILTWNCKKYIEECLDSLHAFRRRPDAEVIVVDNASSDGTPELVQDSYPEVILIRSSANLGFTKGSNLGIRRAAGKYLCLINPDVRVLDGCIEKMSAYMERNPQVGLLGPRMLNAHGQSDRSYMGTPTLWNMLCRALALDKMFPKCKYFSGFLMFYFDRNRVAEVDILNGWFWMARSAAVEQIGLLDEDLFMYADDLDWSQRFRNAGWRVVYFPEAESIHYGGASSAHAPIRYAVEMQKANFQYWQKNHGILSQRGYRMIVTLHQLVRAIGYFLLFVTPGSHRDETRFKLERAVACLLWAIGIPQNRKNHSAAQPEAKSL